VTQGWTPHQTRGWIVSTDWECATPTCGNVNHGYRPACRICAGTAGKGEQGRITDTLPAKPCSATGSLGQLDKGAVTMWPVYADAAGGQGL
jgi:hypothetical protein